MTSERHDEHSHATGRRGGWASIRLMLDVYAGEDESAGLIETVFGTFESQSLMGKSHNAPNMKAKSK